MTFKKLTEQLKVIGSMIFVTIPFFVLPFLLALCLYINIWNIGASVWGPDQTLFDFSKNALFAFFSYIAENMSGISEAIMAYSGIKAYMFFRAAPDYSLFEKRALRLFKEDTEYKLKIRESDLLHIDKLIQDKIIECSSKKINNLINDPGREYILTENGRTFIKSWVSLGFTDKWFL